MRSLLFVLLVACGGSKATSSDTTQPVGSQVPAAGGDCVKTGCSGTVCAEPGNEIVTTCEMKPEYACYGQAECKRQGDGKCGWTQSPALTKCLASPPAMDNHSAPQ